MHLAGLRQIVALRGGVDQLGWPTLLKPSVIGHVPPTISKILWLILAQKNGKLLCLPGAEYCG